MKNSSDTIGNRTRDIPACSAVPQPTAPPGASKINMKVLFVPAPRFRKRAVFLILEDFDSGVI